MQRLGILLKRVVYGRFYSLPSDRLFQDGVLKCSDEEWQQTTFRAGFCVPRGATATYLADSHGNPSGANPDIGILRRDDKGRLHTAQGEIDERKD